MLKFVVIGVGGYIAPRHLEAIKFIGGDVIAAYDPNDSVGLLDRYFPNCRFFTDFERLESFVESEKIDYVSICSPNYMHLSHIKFALRVGANAICEKPLVLHEKDIDDLIQYEKKYNRKVFTVLQLRVHQAVINLRDKVSTSNKPMHDVNLTYVTSRGNWYFESWKGQVQKSGGLSSNIGVHFFDMLAWIFGDIVEMSSKVKSSDFESGSLIFDKARVEWSLSVNKSHLPKAAVLAGKTTFRSIVIDGEEFEFSDGFTELHNTVYTDIVSGKGYGLEDARLAIRIVEKIRQHG